MGWRFRKYIKIAPGVKLNISKSGVSTTIGGKGASINVGKNGAYLNTSIPGTGWYNRQKISSGKKAYKASSVYSSTNDSNEDSFFKIGNNWGCVFRWYGLFAIVYLVIVLYKIIAGKFENTEANISVLVFVGVSVIFVFITPVMNFLKSLFKRPEEASKEEIDVKSNYIIDTPTNKVNNEKNLVSEKTLPEDISSKAFEVALYDPDPLFEEAARIVLDSQSGSTSLIQRKFSIGYNRAGRLMDQLEVAHIVGPAKGSKPRDILICDKKDLERIISAVRENYRKAHGTTTSSENTNNPTDQILRFTSSTKNSPSSNHGEKKKDKKLTAKCLPNIGFADPLLEDVANYLVTKRECSSLALQREFTMGHNRASRVINQLEALKIVRRTNNNDFEILVEDIDSLDNLFVSLNDPNRPDNIFGITEEFFNSTREVVNLLLLLCKEIKNDVTVMNIVEGSLPQSYGTKEQKFAALLHADIRKIYQNIGHSTENLKNREGFALVLFSSKMIGGDLELEVSYNTINHLDKLSDDVSSVFSNLSHSFDKYPDDNFFFIGQILNRCRRDDLYVRYFNLLYRLFSIIAKADNTITETEANWLKMLMEFTQQETKEDINFGFDKPLSAKPLTSVEVSIPEEKNPIAELNQLIGLASVKAEISSLSNLVKVQQVRKSRGMAVSNVSYHCVFTGNPGTGKTTVARIVADIYKQLGVLKKGHLVETDRSGLIAEYVGQTAVKTNTIIDSALDGVLFIDEAYSLVQGGQNDYGKEAIATLLKRMEDDRDRLVVILAGYSKEMGEFINANSGLQSRFNRYIDFPDYSSEELLQIFQFILTKNECHATEEAITRVKEYIQYAVNNKDQNFGNARFVRNLFEKVLTQQANRLASMASITNEMLSTIEISDVEKAI